MQILKGYIDAINIDDQIELIKNTVNTNYSKQLKTIKE